MKEIRRNTEGGWNSWICSVGSDDRDNHEVSALMAAPNDGLYLISEPGYGSFFAYLTLLHSA